MTLKVLLDTDIGSDIDDAICLAYLLSQPKCELVGITTVSGEACKRAMLASAICKVARKNIPIISGLEEPIVGPQRQHFATQAKALKNWDHDIKFLSGGLECIKFMKDIISSNPGEIVLLGIGPLTNIAMLFKTCPEIPKLLKGLVLMCGVFSMYTQYPERIPINADWNAGCDPIATSIVYNNNISSSRSIGVDITSQVKLSKKEALEKFKGYKLLEIIKDFSEVWFQNFGYIIFHDPLAATTLFNDKICEFERGNVEVETISNISKGLTYWKPDKRGMHEVAIKVDCNEFFKHYFSVLK